MTHMDGWDVGCEAEVVNLLCIFMFGLCFFGGPQPVMRRGYTHICSQGSFLPVLGGPFVMLGMEPWLATCKAKALPTVPSLWLLTVHVVPAARPVSSLQAKAFRGLHIKGLQ